MEDYVVSHTDERCVEALLVALYRADQFSNGIMEKFITKGIVSSWLKRLKSF